MVARLAYLANRLDGTRLDQRHDELSEFNGLSGTGLPLTDFQGIYKSEDPEDFVRRVLFQQGLEPDPNISIAELTEIVSLKSRWGRAKDRDYIGPAIPELVPVTTRKHPSKTDLIYWPNLVPELPQGREPTAAEVAELAMLNEL